MDEALDAAKAAQKAWAKTPAIERAAYLKKMADGIRRRQDEFVDIIMREQGKTRTWATVEVAVTADYFDYMASFARHIEGEVIPSDRRGETIMLFKEPIGVVAGILPWNFPFFLIARKAGAALITGCTIVIKPSQLTPENCCEFAKVVDETGLPAGVFNVITGKGSVVGNALAASPKIGIVSVTGSVGAGNSIVAGEVVRGIVAIALPTVDKSNRVADADDVVLLVLVVSACPTRGECHLFKSVGKALDVRFVKADVEVCRNGDVFLLHDCCVQGQLNTFVAGRSRVLPYRSVARSCDVVVDEQVVGVVPVHIDVTIESLVEETEVETDITGGALLPGKHRVGQHGGHSQVRVGVLAYTITLRTAVGAVELAEHVTGEFVVTYLTV